MCKGPKQDDCGKVEVTNLQNMSDITFHLDFSKDCLATMVFHNTYLKLKTQ